MALCRPQLQRVLLNHHRGYECNHKATKRTLTIKGRGGGRGGGGGGGGCCSAIAIDAPSSLTSVSSIRWGSALVQGAREEMEDDLIIVDQSEDLSGFSYAAVFDGHAGFSSVKFLRNELYKECVAALQGGFLLKGKELDTVKKALKEAFESADVKLLNWLETSSEEVDSGSTATVILIGDDKLFISHVGDSSVVLSQSGKAEVLTNSHRPYGSNQASLQEIRRIREAGGWIVNGRVCGDIAVSRAFGDMRFKNKKNEMLEKGVEEGRWSQKFASRIEFHGDLVAASPDVLQVALGSNAECVILASDGLWDYINSSDAVAFVRNQLRQHGDVQRASEALAQMALDRGSQDNISIVVADLGQTDWASVPLQQQNFVYELAQALVTMGVVSFGIWMTSQL